MTNDITPNDLRVAQALGELKATVDNLSKLVSELRMDVHERITAVAKDSARTYEALDDRVTELERWRYGVLGASAAIGAAVSLALKFIP